MKSTDNVVSKITLLAGCALACVALSGCAGMSLGGLPTPGNANAQQFFDNLDKFNTAAAQHCAGSGNLDWNPPLPPTGSLHMQCAIGQAQLVQMPQVTSATLGITAPAPTSPPK